jgi:hypothetical protein
MIMPGRSCVAGIAIRVKLLALIAEVPREDLAFERFHNSRALSDIVQCGIFLRKMPLERSGFGVQQLWNRYSLSLL